MLGPGWQPPRDSPDGSTLPLHQSQRTVESHDPIFSLKGSRAPSKIKAGQDGWDSHLLGKILTYKNLIYN